MKDTTMTSTWNWNDLLPAAPEVFLAFSGMALLILGVLRGNEGTRAINAGAMFAFVMAAVLLVGLSWDTTTAAFSGLFVMDSFAGLLKLLILGGLTAALALTQRYFEQENLARPEIPVLILFAGLGMMIMLSANSLLSLYVGLELQSLSLYVLAAIRRDDVKSSEAGMKYFVLGALASGMLLFGASLVYGYTGSLGFDGIASSLEGVVRPDMGLIVGLVFILTGLAFKISAVPFHMWTPDVYEGAPTAITALFAIVPKLAAMGLMMRLLLEPFGGAASQWTGIIVFLSFASMAVGALAGVAQNNIKRLMAYSSIGNMGYALMGIVAANEAGAQAVIVYMAIYMVMSAGTFGIVLAMRRGGKAVESISDLAGLSRSQPVMAYAMAILMFSMAGIPPLAGFFGKMMVFQAAVSTGHFTLATLGVLSSVVAAYYYLRIIKVMFFDEAAPELDSEPSFLRHAVVAVSLVLILLFALMPNILMSHSAAAAGALFG